MQTTQSPFDILRNLAEQAVEVESSRDSASDLSVAKSCIGFSLCGKQMVSAMGEVVEVSKILEHTVVPGAKPWLLGISNLRGRLLPLVDLESFVGSKLIGNRRLHRVLVVEIGEVFVGLVVSRVFGLKHFTASQIDSKQSCENELYAHLIESICAEGDEQWLEFSMQRLLADKQFNDVACTHFSDTKVYATSVA